MENTEIKLKIEGEVNALKREYKVMYEKVATLKNEYEILSAMNEKQKAFKDEQNTYLKEVLNDISDAKVQWMHEKEAEYVDIAKKREEIKEIVDKKSELDKQESKITTLLEKNTAVLNENRTLKLELESKTTDIESKKKELETIRESIEKDKKSLSKEIISFKDKMNKIIKEVELL